MVLFNYFLESSPIEGYLETRQTYSESSLDNMTSDTNFRMVDEVAKQR